MQQQQQQQQQQEEEETPVMVCLQAQGVAGLPAALDGRTIEVECLGACARASSTAGVAVFHDQVLLLHCLASSSSSCWDWETITLSLSTHHPTTTHLLATLSLDLSDLHLYCRPSPTALRFPLAHGALLTLALHHRRVALHPHPRFCCFGFHFHHHHHRARASDDESAGFITIDKEDAISKLPPSDDLLSTDDERPNPSRHLSTMDDYQTMETDSSVEDEFLAMLDDDKTAYSDIHLDKLIKDAQAELFLVLARSTSS